MSEKYNYKEAIDINKFDNFLDKIIETYQLDKDIVEMMSDDGIEIEIPYSNDKKKIICIPKKDLIEHFNKKETKWINQQIEMKWKSIWATA